MTTTAYELNFDALVGPTHNFAGLSPGNLASKKNKGQKANPKEAALQSLEKMKLLHDLGIKQAVLPPHERPHLKTIRRLGFFGADRELPEKVFKEDERLLQQVSSSSPMWSANIATATPSIDSQDEHVHITPANLISNFHRSIECSDTKHILKTIFQDPLYFTIHDPLPKSAPFSDEGAANHNRFCVAYGDPGLHLFVYGRTFEREYSELPARQTEEASLAIARLHKILPNRLLFARQSEEAIDAGVFHNDVISVANQNLFFMHEKAFASPKTVMSDLQEAFLRECETDLNIIEVKEKDVTLRDAVKTYLFNAQLLTLPDGQMTLICPLECKNHFTVGPYLENLIKQDNNPILDVHFVDLTESMKNGGGPACTRLRLPLTDLQRESITANIFFTDELYANLKEWIQKHFRDEMTLNDLRDKNLVDETQLALNELTTLLNLGTLYDFQR